MRTRRENSQYSVRTMLLIPMLIMNLLIIGIFLLSFQLSDIQRRMERSEIDSLRHTAATRAEMLQKWFGDTSALAANTARGIQKTVNSSTPGRGNIAPRLADSNELIPVLEQAAMPHLLDAMKTNTVTGLYVLYDASLDSLDDRGFLGSQVAGVYLRDGDIGRVTPDDSELSMVCGPAELAREYGISLQDGWTSEFPLEPLEDLDFLLAPYQAAETDHSLPQELVGYWSGPAVRQDGEEVFCYTVPLVDALNRPYGVVGAEISLTELRASLDADDLGYPENAFYAVSFPQVEGRAVNVCGDGFAEHGLDGVPPSPVSLEEQYGPGTLELRFGGAARVLALVQPLDLRVEGNVHNDAIADLVLVAGVDRGSLFSEVDTINRFLMASVLVALVVGVALSVFGSYLFVIPISRLVTSLQRVDREDDIELDHTGIKEIDTLIHAIEALGRDLRECADRTTQAIELTGMPIGFWALEEEKQRVYVTDYLIDLFGLEEDAENNYIGLELYTRLYERLQESRADGGDDVFLLDFVENRPFRWLRIRLGKRPRKTFGIVMDVTDEILERRRLELERDTDMLTGLLNRSAFLSRAQTLIAEQPGRQGVMLFADLDNLKFVNDSYGHDIGDRYIRAAAGIFNQFSQYRGVVARFSGDEFAVFLYGGDSRQELGELVTRVLEQTEDIRIDLPDGDLLKVRFSLGFSWYPDDSDNLDQLLRYADFAMYETKRSLKGSVREFSIESYLKNSYLVEKNEAFNQFVEHNQVRYAFQPIVDVFSGTVFGYEALMRPTHTAFQSPQQVLQIARTQAKLYQIERMTIYNIYTWLDEHQAEMEGCKLFINSIPNQALGDRDNEELTARFGHLFHKVVMEVTENEQTEADFLLDKIATIRRFGNTVAIDDYGSGYSNEVTVLSTGPDYIKLDITLVSGIHFDENRQTLVRNIISYCHPQNIKVIAEGIESEAEAETMIRLGADYLQGYFLCRPAFELQQIDPGVSEMIRGFARKYRDRRKRGGQR